MCPKSKGNIQLVNFSKFKVKLRDSILSKATAAATKVTFAVLSRYGKRSLLFMDLLPFAKVQLSKMAREGKGLKVV